MIEINNPQQLVELLIQLFPMFSEEWDEGESYGYNSNTFTYHCVFQELAPVCAELLNKASPEQRKDFCDLLNSMVENGGEQENAVSTSLLEHATQVGIRKIIKPYLTPKALKELH